jgi:hypothetical protein
MHLVTRGLLFLRQLDLTPAVHFRKFVPLSEAATREAHRQASRPYASHRFFADPLWGWLRPEGSSIATQVRNPDYLALLVARPSAGPAEENVDPRRVWENLTTRYGGGTVADRDDIAFMVGWSPIRWYRMAYVMWDADRLVACLGGADQTPFIHPDEILSQGRSDKPWVVVDAQEDPEERRIFGEGYHDDYEGRIYD